jgi:hypothetical protein
MGEHSRADYCLSHMNELSFKLDYCHMSSTPFSLFHRHLIALPFSTIS